MRVLEISRGVVPEDETKRPYLDLALYLNEDGALSGDIFTSTGSRRLPQDCIIEQPQRFFMVPHELKGQVQYLRATEHPNQIVVTLRDEQFHVCCSFLQSQLGNESELASAISDLTLHATRITQPGYKPKPKTQREKRSPALHAKFALHKAVSGSDTSLIDEIVKLHPEQLRLENESGFTPLEQAVWTGSSEAVRRLIEHGADVNVRDGFGQTPLHVACTVGNMEKVNLLVEHGADINAKTNDGGTAIHFAIMANRRQLLRYLKEKGAVFNQADGAAREALRIGRQMKGHL